MHWAVEYNPVNLNDHVENRRANVCFKRGLSPIFTSCASEGGA